MNKTERIKMVKAMEFIARQLNDETIFLDSWLWAGVADGDIQYGDLDVKPEDLTEDSDLSYYLEDEAFASLMRCFLHCMAKAKHSGGLYCDDVCSVIKSKVS